MSSTKLITNARIVTPDADFLGSVAIENKRIVEVLPERTFSEGLDAGGAWLIPGVIDMHTDYLEKEIAPRPSAEFPLELAFHFMDMRALACGVTTVLGAVRISGESESGGSIWRRDGVELGRRYDELAEHAKARHLIHLRWDPNFAPAEIKIDAVRELKSIGNLVFNENIPGQRQFRNMEDLARKRAKQRGVSLEEGRAILDEEIRVNSQINNRPLVRAAFESSSVALGSHDDTTVEHVRDAHSMGCTISEMPTTLEAATEAKRLGMEVIMGAPNYYRGGSHCGNLSCAEALDKGLVDVLCSDFHFPSLLGSAVKMLSAGVPPHQAINLITRNPARVLGRDAESGSIEAGKIADLTLFRDRDSFAQVSHSWVGGELVYASN